MVVTKKMLANYLGIHRNSVAPYFNDYLEDSGSKRYLLLSDVAKVDGVSLDYVREKMGAI
ncbi:MAG: hypothetical protein NXH86_02790 [Flavobacteriaceae bacterium]|jgi:hypothetical protein|uniref:Uncharacterized protein n=1 Tax=Flagellimonas alvinocaridis TaxID=2530200 RepID=A0A4S8RFN1_9FLAO|nr:MULTISPECIES: hypothetical protein [Allomuricauda]MCR9263053.1 hypothetical protein [Flavobacteriaceae bacterium]THV57088.1 hypothetical protein EZV76_15845 [Allomuricauda alvinocaridis]